MKIYNHLNTNLALIVGGNKSVIIPPKGLSDTIYTRTLSDGKLRMLLSKYKVKIDGQAERTYLRYHKIYFKEYTVSANKPTSMPTNTPADTACTPAVNSVSTKAEEVSAESKEETAEHAGEQASAIEDANQVQEDHETATSAQFEASKTAHYVVEIIDLDD